MADVRWYLNRLRAMSMEEVLWRFSQKRLEKTEKKTFGRQHIPVTRSVFYTGKEKLVFHGKRLPIDRKEAGPACLPEKLSSGIPLPGGYDYEEYKKDWHVGFQTDHKWPLTFSYELQYKQRDDIGDARTNWELNRHFQFALLACNYYRTGEEKFLTELSELFENWDEENPFLHGISWTSVMETAIRDINWIYTLGFLELARKEAGQRAQEKIKILRRQLRNGIINITTYISAHYSRYSSANNHVIVEAAAMGIAGIVMDCGEWYDLAVSVLQYEIGRQNYKDGVNKEASLHYQSFFMEAVGLLMLAMTAGGRNIPQNWRNTMCRMSRYLSDCRGRHGETVVFGDDDEGKILDLQGNGGTDREGSRERDHYFYVLQLMSVVLPERYVQQVTDITLMNIVPENLRDKVEKKPYYRNEKSVCYEEGGVSLLKSGDGRALIGIDHGALGFGTIAAHGHADALSFQMYLDGRAVLADAGTYLYHTDLESRNAFRSTRLHNTVTVDGKDQSEMLGAFLWGKRAETKLLKHNLPAGNCWEDRETGSGDPGEYGNEESGADNGSGKEATESGDAAAIQYVEAEHDGYAPVIHRRRFEFDGRSRLTIYDRLLHVEKETAYEVSFLFSNHYEAVEEGGSRVILAPRDDGGSGSERCRRVIMEFHAGKQGDELPPLSWGDGWISGRYGIRESARRLRISGRTDRDLTIVTAIRWEE